MLGLRSLPQGWLGPLKQHSGQGRAGQGLLPAQPLNSLGPLQRSLIKALATAMARAALPLQWPREALAPARLHKGHRPTCLEQPGAACPPRFAPTLTASPPELASLPTCCMRTTPWPAQPKTGRGRQRGVGLPLGALGSSSAVLLGPGWGGTRWAGLCRLRRSCCLGRTIRTKVILINLFISLHMTESDVTVHKLFTTVQ